MASARVAPIRPEVVQQQQQDNPHSAIEMFNWLPCKVTSEIPVPRFTVGDLLNLRKGTVVQTVSATTNDVPVYVNKILLGRGKFEVVEDKLAIRLTELA